MLGVPLLAALATGRRRGPRARLDIVDAAALATLMAAASWGFTRARSSASSSSWCHWCWSRCRQLLAWRVRVPVVVGLLVGQTLLVQVLFATRW